MSTESPGPSTIGSRSGSSIWSVPEIMMSTSIVAVVCLMAALAQPARAQEAINHASVAGRVTDETGAQRARASGGHNTDHAAGDRSGARERQRAVYRHDRAILRRG